MLDTPAPSPNLGVPSLEYEVPTQFTVAAQTLEPLGSEIRTKEPEHRYELFHSEKEQSLIDSK